MPSIVAGAPSGLGSSYLTATVAESLYAPRAGNIDTTVRKLAEATADVNILVLGDSSVSQSGQWADVLFPDIQALYPHRTLQKATWDNDAHDWGSFATVGSAGSGSYKVKFWQGAATGTVCEQPLNYWQDWVAGVQPDCVIVYYGHNYGATAAGGGHSSDAVMDQVFRERYLRFVAEIKRSCPYADVLLVSQNPYLAAGARTDLSNFRAQIIRQIAADLGCAYGPVLEAFEATDDATDYLGADLIHPNTAGAELAAATLLPIFTVKNAHEITPRGVSPFLLPGSNLLTNADFASFASPPTLTGWTASNVTLSKDSTYYESTNGYSVKGIGTAGATCQMYQQLPIRKVAGQVITVAARFYVPAAVAASTPGRVTISGDGGLTSVTSGTITSVRDTWVWVWATARIPDAATYATASIVFANDIDDYSSVDRVSCVVGHLPRDL